MPEGRTVGNGKEGRNGEEANANEAASKEDHDAGWTSRDKVTFLAERSRWMEGLGRF